MTNPFLFISCTQASSEKAESLLIVQSFKEVADFTGARLEMVWENKEGLSKVYNRKILEYQNSGVEYLVFVHDDVFIDDLKVCAKIKLAHQRFGFELIGVAGGVNPCFEANAEWHRLCLGTERRGAICHMAKGMILLPTTFGFTPSPVTILDGVFMAVHLPSILKKGWRFNENYEFHHYDLSSCLDAAAKGMLLGVFPIHLQHASGGLSSYDDPSWVKSNAKFLAEYPLPRRKVSK